MECCCVLCQVLPFLTSEVLVAVQLLLTSPDQPLSCPVCISRLQMSSILYLLQTSVILKALEVGYSGDLQTFVFTSLSNRKHFGSMDNCMWIDGWMFPNLNCIQFKTLIFHICGCTGTTVAFFFHNTWLCCKVYTVKGSGIFTCTIREICCVNIQICLWLIVSSLMWLVTPVLVWIKKTLRKKPRMEMGVFTWL